MQSGDNSSDLDYKATSSLSANGGTIRDNASNNTTLTLASPGASGSIGANKSIVIDGILPTVDNVSSSTSDGRYFTGDNITITVGFDENVYVDNSSGNPRIQLETGTNDRYANYVSGNSTKILSLLYTVQSDDNSTDLEYKATNSLSTNGGTIRDSVVNDATLTLPTLGASGSLSANKAIIIGGVLFKRALVDTFLLFTLLFFLLNRVLRGWRHSVTHGLDLGPNGFLSLFLLHLQS